MARKRLLWQLYPSYVLVAALSLVCVGWYAAHLLEREYRVGLESQLRLARDLLDEQLTAPLAADQSTRLRAITDAMTTGTDINLGVLAPDDQAVVQSGRHAAELPAGTRRREDEVVVRTPIVRDDREMGTIVAWVPASAVQSAMRRIQFALLGAGLLLAAGAALFCLLVARQVSRPFEEIRDVAARFARGDLEFKLAASGSEEMSGLAGA